MEILNKNSYHFVGIGGIGTSAIARLLQLRGKKVSGSDAEKSEITDDLEYLGIKISIGHSTANVGNDVEVVIYSVAIPETNPELVEARRRDLVCVTYPEALGELSKQMFTIAVSGTHGKTTTTAMIGHILVRAGLDPTIIVGSKLLGENSNLIVGQSKYLVVEACEYRRSFLNIQPQILVITNIEAEHLDYYKDLDDIKSAFEALKAKVPEKGGVIITEKEYGEVEIKSLPVPGEHNRLDAKAAVRATEALGIDREQAIAYLQDFRGTWRRLEYKGEKDSNIYYDDYAHHPTEIRASLSGLREKYPGKQIVCVFKPHQQGRIKALFDDFVGALSSADRVLIAPIYIVREVEDKSFTNHNLSEAVNKHVPANTVENLAELRKYLGEIKDSCIVMMGAGDIYEWTAELLRV